MVSGIQNQCIPVIRTTILCINWIFIRFMIKKHQIEIKISCLLNTCKHFVFSLFPCKSLFRNAIQWTLLEIFGTLYSEMPEKYILFPCLLLCSQDTMRTQYTNTCLTKKISSSKKSAHVATSFDLKLSSTYQCQKRRSCALLVKYIAMTLR